jgi:hypothetical protein
MSVDAERPCERKGHDIAEHDHQEHTGAAKGPDLTWGRGSGISFGSPINLAFEDERWFP